MSVKTLKRNLRRAARVQAKATRATRKPQSPRLKPTPEPVLSLALQGNGTRHKRPRPGPTSVRFSPDDLALLNKLKARFKTDGPTTTLRKCMELAEHAVVCTFINEP